MYYRVLYSVAFICLLVSVRVYAQHDLQFHKISVENGLSQSSVYNIYQDKEGFIWFATGDGINKYDGRDFITYKSRFGDTGSGYPRQRNINSNLVEDRYNHLWANCDAGVFYMNKKYGRFKMVLPFNLIRYSPHIDLVDNDTLWISLDNFGIATIDIRNLQYHKYKADSVNKPTVITNAIIARKGIYIADTKGILLFNKHTFQFSRILQLEGTLCIRQLHDGRFIIGGINCVYLYDATTGAYERIATSATNSAEKCYWKSVTEHIPTNTVYFGSSTNGSLCALNISTKACKIYNWQKSTIASLIIDRSENLWVGTDGGGAYKADLKPVKFNCYPTKKTTNNISDSGWMVKSIYRDEAGNIWIGTFNKGLIIYDPNKQTTEQVSLGKFPHGATPQVGFIGKDSSGDIIVTSFNTVLWLDSKTRKIKDKIEVHGPQKTGNDPFINYLYEWKQGYYIGCSNEQLFTIITTPKRRLEVRGFQHMYSWQYKIQRVRDGSFYIGGREGFQHIRMTSDTTVQIIEQDLYDIGIRQFYESAQHPYLFMASEAGLIVRNKNTKRYAVYDERNGLSNSYVYSILPENDTSLWISTNAGISNVHISYEQDSVIAKFTNFTTKDGLQSNEFNTGAYYQDIDGTLFFGGIYGINWFNPKNLHLNPYKAIPVIASIEVNDTLFTKDTASYVRKIELPWSKNTLTFSFKALEFTDPASNAFSYKLAGFDERWVYNQTGKVRYPNLPPGSYTFLLKAANNDGIWNDQPLQISIIINPPYWHTWWFRMLLIITALALVYALNRYYVKQKIKEKTLMLDKQRALYEERMRISKDVHDDLGSGLSKITLMAEIAKQQTHQTGGESIEHISQISKDLIGNMRDLIWVLNPENTTLDNLIARIREYSSEYLEGLPIQFIADLPEQLPSIPISRDAQRNIFLTVKEAIHNCVKHAGATIITISATINEDNISLKISDNGNGCKQEISKGNGLRNMKLRIERTGGTFHMSSIAGEGTTIQISIPIRSIILTST